MALLGMVSGDVSLNTSDFSISVSVVFFDDSDPDNVGYVDGHAPRIVLYHYTFTYASSLQGSALQQQLAADIKAKGQAFEAATAALTAAKSLLPAGALVTVDG